MIWDSSNCALVKAITSHSPLVDSLSILFANNFVSTEKCLKNLKIWSPNGQELTQIETNNASDEIGCVCVVSIDYLATSDLEENLIKVWHVRTGALVQILNGHKSCVTALFEMPNGNLISGSSDSQIKIWQPLSGQLIKTLNE
jgi:WD40 repeat protein